MPLILPALRMLLFASVIAPLLLIGGCGLKGDLVLPEPAEPASSKDDTEEKAAGDGPGVARGKQA